MKKLTLSLIAATLIASGANAGSYAEPQVEAPVIVEDTTNSSAGAALPLLMALMTLAVAIQ